VNHELDGFERRGIFLLLSQRLSGVTEDTIEKITVSSRLDLNRGLHSF
jgi:hypothetical protein